ncbi:MAG TPA: hypothetical protein VJ276_01670 [Thermoanaerobaculia bacterium]|nr:hypothetical protein [Thermoanaerobaculia bacterium]
MRTAIISLSLSLVAAFSTAAATAPDTASLRIAGHHLPPGDRFKVSVRIEYTIIDLSKGKMPKRSDGSRVFEEDMVEYRESGKPVPAVDFVVPASGEVPARAFTVRFNRPLALVPDRLAAVRFHVSVERTTTGPDGKPKTIKHDDTFPVPLGGDSTSGGVSRCLLFEGFPNGALSVALHADCTPSSR